MRNWISGLCAVTLLLSLCGCGSNDTEVRSLASDSVTSATGPSSLTTLAQELSASGVHCATDTGYYYLSEDWTELTDGTVGMPLFYVDYASGQEVYLCSDSSCAHNSDRCSAIFSETDFCLNSSVLFVYQDKLYLLSKEYDEDGSTFLDLSGSDNNEPLSEPRPATLYRMNLDGTNREKRYTFDEALTLEDWVFGDETGLYFITKKLSTRQNGSTSIVSSSDRQVVRLDLDTGTLDVVQTLNLTDNVQWKVLGCAGTNLILSGIAYQKELTDQEALDDDIWRAAYLDSTTRYIALDLNTGKQLQLAEVGNQALTAALVADGQFYLSQNTNQEITQYDPTTGAKTMVAKLPQNNFLGMLDGKLCCRDWDLSQDYTYYFVDIATGEVQHSKLVNQRLGWDLEFMAETASDALVVYDYEATSGIGEGSYEIQRYQLGLIDKDDLFQGVDNFRPIQMIGKGR